MPSKKQLKTGVDGEFVVFHVFLFCVKSSQTWKSIVLFRIFLLHFENEGNRACLDAILRSAPQAPNSHFFHQNQGFQGKSGGKME